MANISNGKLENTLLIRPNKQQNGAYENQNFLKLLTQNGPKSEINNISKIVTTESDDVLGPLPSKWETAYTERGELYFIDHNTETSHWLDPRLSKFQKNSLIDCNDNELPYGWEKIDDPLYGTYYIDHVNRHTQYENPVLEAKRRVSEQRDIAPSIQCNISQYDKRNSIIDNVNFNTLAHNKHVSRNKFLPYCEYINRNRIVTTILKSEQGLGISIIGEDNSNNNLLQIKSIVPNSPAWLNGQLKSGDALLYVNGICVVEYSYKKMIQIFQSICPGQFVTIEVCRGYSLPIEINDNNRIVSTIPVNNTYRTSHSDVLSVDLDNVDENNCCRSFEKKLDDNLRAENMFFNEELNISVMKGPIGFGFTISDSTDGQKVKQIIDKNVCCDLHEGDILLEINNIQINNKSHSEVVEILKNCSKNMPTLLKIRRIVIMINPNGFKIRNVEELNKNNLTIFRSKTPTADIMRTQKKEIPPIRSKTPLINSKLYANRQTISNLNNEDIVHSDCFSNKKNLENLFLESRYASDNSLKSCNIKCKDELDTENKDVKNVIAVSNSIDDYKTSEENSLINSVSNINMNINLDANTTNKSYNQMCISSNCFSKICADDHVYSNKNYVDCTNKFNPLKKQECNSSEMLTCETNSFKENQCYEDKNILHSNTNEITPKDNQKNEYRIFDVILKKQSTGFGFRIMGGKEEGSQATVGHIVPNGSVDKDNRIVTGDEILCIDGISVVDSSHHKVVSLMAEAALRGQVNIKLRRHRNFLEPFPQNTYDVVISRHEDEDFGFVIVSALNNDFCLIGQIVIDSPADRCGELKVGDCIMAVNKVNITKMTHSNVVNHIKNSGLHVCLTIGC